METQSKSNPQSGNRETETDNRSTADVSNQSADLAAANIEPEPFSEEDTFRTARIDSLNSETSELLSPAQVELAGLEDLAPRELQQLHHDVRERQEWRSARQDGFNAVLRLARPVPPRGKRIL